MRRIIYALVFVWLLSGLLIAFNAKRAKSEPATIIVPDDYPSIQEAIYAATPGDHIMVRNGTYHEWITVNQSLTLYSEYKHGAIIDGLNARKMIFTVIAEDVGIIDFSIKNSGTDSPFDNAGIRLNSVNDARVQNNIFTHNLCGVWVVSSSNVTISGNDISAGNIDGGTGIWLQTSSNCTVTDNKVSKNHGTGIKVDGGSTFNVITRNLVEENGYINTGRHGANIAVTGYDTRYNSITCNNISRSYYLGVNIQQSDSNIYFHNNLVDNYQQVKGFPGDERPNVWDDGYPSGGNYWSDYTSRYPDASERDGSGIWDTPYVIDTSNIDRFPLMNPWPNERHDVAIMGIATSKSGCLPVETLGEGRPVDINVTVTNQGDFNETFTVRLWANETMLAELEVIELTPGTTMLWKEDDVVLGGAKGNIRIVANATVVAEEIDTGDNTHIYGYIFHTLAGDADGDRDVDIFDIVRMAGVYGIRLPDPRYNPNCDIDGDGDIDIFDIVRAAGNYGKSW